WGTAPARGRTARAAWEARLAASPRRQEFESAVAGDLPESVFEALSTFRQQHFESATNVATRKASEMALAVINEATEQTVGGSADLTHSNLTITKGMARVSPGDFSGRYIHYGIREHGMAAAMNGLALHGGLVPYGGTFLCFADYARGAMRLSALMGQRVIYVMTHDSIGLGEDGPTHQPVEHLAMLRATPNLNVFRPADIIETAECWELALRSKHRPSVLVLSRQNLPMLRTKVPEASRSAQGAYLMRKPVGRRDLTLIATGSEVEIARAAADLLQERHHIRVALVSMPCWELFEEQDEAYRAEVLGTAPRIAVEAAARLGWDRWIGDGGAFVGMTGFGASAPAAELYRHFGITAEAIADAACAVVQKD
ncbi:transketolase, partial [Mesorhizobium sp. M8A.F.Ca.ET.059.01.1.1]